MVNVQRSVRWLHSLIQAGRYTQVTATVTRSEKWNLVRLPPQRLERSEAIERLEQLELLYGCVICQTWPGKKWRLARGIALLLERRFQHEKAAPKHSPCLIGESVKFL